MTLLSEDGFDVSALWAAAGMLAVVVCALLALNVHARRQLRDQQTELAVSQRSRDDVAARATQLRQAAVPLPPPPYAADVR